jgi:hypothetical protein
MSWDSKPSYPPFAIRTMTLKATDFQVGRWDRTAKAKQMARGAFIALAADTADTYVLFIEGLEDGEPVLVRGYLSPPFGVFYGTPAGVPSYLGAHRFTLVYLPSSRVLAAVRTYREAQALAAELARLWYRGDGSEPAGNPAPVLQHLPV